MSQVDLKDLFRLLKLIGGKFVIVEEGKPVAVLMDYKEFENLAAPVYEKKLIEKVEKINEEITEAQLRDLREEVITDWPLAPSREPFSTAQETLGSSDPELRIEPLPSMEE